MFKAQNTLVLEHKKVNNHKSMRKIFHSIAKIGLLKQFRNMVLWFFSVIIYRNNSIEKWKWQVVYGDSISSKHLGTREYNQ